MIGVHEGNLGARIFFIWGAFSAASLAFIYFLIPETRGLSLEQVDRMLEETIPRHSTGWIPRSNFVTDIVLPEKEVAVEEIELMESKSAPVAKTVDA